MLISDILNPAAVEVRELEEGTVFKDNRGN